MSSFEDKYLDEYNAEDRKELENLYRIKRTELSTMLYRGIPVEGYHIVFKNSTDNETKLYSFKDAKKLFIENRQVEINGRKLELAPTFQYFLDTRRQQLDEGMDFFRTRTDFNSYYDNPNGDGIIVIYVSAQDKVRKSEFDFTRSIIAESVPIGTSTYGGKSVTNITNRFKHIILITKQGLGHLNADTLKQSPAIEIEHVYDSDWMFPAFKHALAPKRVNYYPPGEVKKFTEKEGIPYSKLPNILERDVQSRALNAKPGSVIEVITCGIDVEDAFFARLTRAEFQASGVVVKKGKKN